MKKLIITFFIITVFLLSFSLFSFTSCKTQEMAVEEMPEETLAEEEMTEETMAEEEMTEETMVAEVSEETMASEESTSGYMDVTAQEAKKLIDENPDLIIIDVSPKYAEGHLPGAINYYLGDGSLDKAIPSLDPEAKYLVYCHVDSVAIAGAQALVDAGFKNVYRLEGNYAAWVDAGYPVEK